MSFFKDYPLNSKVFDNKIFSIQAKALRFGGFLIDESHKFKLVRFWISALLTLLIAIFYALQLARLTIGNSSASGLSIGTSFLFLSTSIGVYNTFLRRKRVARMLAFLHNDLESLKIKSDAIEEKLFKATHRYMKILTICIWTPSILAGVIAFIDLLYRLIFNPDSVFNLEEVHNGTGSELLLIKVFPFREVHNGLFIGYIFPLFALLLGANVIPLWHTFNTSLMTYVLLKWNILHKRLSEMDISKVVLEYNEVQVYAVMTNENAKINYLRTRLCKFCINEQIRIRWFVQELMEVICIPVFADFIIFSFLICFLFYELAVGTPTKLDFFFMCLCILVMTSIVWMYHWHATLIKEESAAMCFAIYSCDWYNYPINVQKMVRMVMTITAYPLEMRAVFVSLNLTTFVDIIRAAYSYFSILNNSS